MKKYNINTLIWNILDFNKNWFVIVDHDYLYAEQKQLKIKGNTSIIFSTVFFSSSYDDSYSHVML